MLGTDEQARRESTARSIRILIADDHAIVRDGVARILETEPGFDVIGLAINGLDAVEQVEELRPDVVLMDITMPRLNGVDATRQIVASHPEVKVIGLSMHERDSMLPRMLEAGAVAYVEKASPPEDLVGVIRSVGERA